MIRIIFVLATYLAVSKSQVTLLNATAGRLYFESPGYPTNYPRDTNLYWLITTAYLDHSAGTWIINLQMEDFDVEPHSSCAYDYLQIFDGNSVEATSLGKYCGVETGIAFSSTGGQIYFHLFSDYSVTAKGFRFSYWATYTAFAIVTKPPPPRNRDYTYHIIGGVLGGIAFFIIVGIIIYCVWRHKFRKKERTKKVVTKGFATGPDGKRRTTYTTTFFPGFIDDDDEKQRRKSSTSSRSSLSDPRPSTSRDDPRFHFHRNVPRPAVYYDSNFPENY